MADTDEAPPEVHHYESLQEVPWDIQKYDSRKLQLIKADTSLVTGHSVIASSPSTMRAYG